MPSFRRPLLAAALAVAALFPAQPAASFDGPGCGGTWTQARDCALRFDGLPISLSGYSESGSVHVWLILDGYPELVLLECEGVGTCEDDLRAEEPLQSLLGGPLPPQSHGYVPRFRCFVEGDAPGTYFCGSGEGQQP